MTRTNDPCLDRLCRELKADAAHFDRQAVIARNHSINAVAVQQAKWLERLARNIREATSRLESDAGQTQADLEHREVLGPLLDKARAEAAEVE